MASSIVDSVLAVLSGAPLRQAAVRSGLDPADLADAIELFQNAGRAALKAQEADRDWYQVRIEFADWHTAEHAAAILLGPQLERAQNTGPFTGWWFIRKHPCWRLRFRPGPGASHADVRKAIAPLLDKLTTDGVTLHWWETVYEPETLAFGGPPGMDAAHRLFHADSVGILDFLRREPVIGRRELSVLLCSALFHSAGQEWHEQGDIWHRVARMRPTPRDTPTDRLRDLTAGLACLMTVDASPTSALLNTTGALAFVAPWAAAFNDAGRELGAGAHDGTLLRGVRDVLAHHVIFHWNRLGLNARTQAILARAATDTVMGISDVARA
ncbi:thiopeptide-type bacteriocin biosynthesis protein [Streptomyces gamaensis]|uniref:Thiopeptide-type bacteriocin biosynthesis protein n=1 Tax=Streptomyces gamaensis TaxID=1763542 RepID=A0ABW0Z1X8_9ACTN